MAFLKLTKGGRRAAVSLPAPGPHPFKYFSDNARWRQHRPALPVMILEEKKCLNLNFSRFRGCQSFGLMIF